YKKLLLAECSFMDYKKTYPVSWVVMQNTIQECFKSMSIDETNRFIYRVSGDVLEILSCRGHYED
ncbi:MAG: hypothetical protein RSD35_00795, partial [Oscillospiraceae bacterium]